MNSILKRWYQLPKSELTKDQIITIKKNLTIGTGINHITKKPNPCIEAYLDEKEEIFVPKYYGLKHFGSPKINEQLQYMKFTTENDTKKMKNYVGVLRNSLGQQDAFDKCMQTLKERGSAYLCLPPGEGKTTVALKILSEIGCKTLVFVHQKFLLNQWIDRTKKYLPDVNIGLLHQKKIDVKEKQIVVTTIQSTLSQNYNCLDEFGMVVFDEAHHVSANYFSKVLQLTSSCYTLALSGTPERKDNAHQLLESWIGPISFRKEKVFPEKCFYHRIPTSYIGKSHFLKVSGTKRLFNNEKMITELCDNEERKNFILKELKSFMEKFPLRRILFIVDRVSSSLWFANQLSFSKDEIVAKELAKKFSPFHAGTNPVERERILAESQVIFATSDIFSEGIDCDSLSVLMLGSPICNLKQLLFRIIRANSKEDPIVVDFIDQMSPFLEWSYARQRYLRKNNFRSLYSSSSEKTTNDSFSEDEETEITSKKKQKREQTNNMSTLKSFF